MRLGLFGPSCEEVARDLIVRYGLGAYDEAIRLSEVARLLPHSLKRSKLYRQAADHIEASFAIARERLHQKITAGPHMLELVARLNSQELARQSTASFARNSTQHETGALSNEYPSDTDSLAFLERAPSDRRLLHDDQARALQMLEKALRDDH
jgi:hypothetical protein